MKAGWACSSRGLWVMSLALGAASQYVAAARAQDPQPQEFRFDGPFRLPPPDEFVPPVNDPSVPAPELRSPWTEGPAEAGTPTNAPAFQFVPQPVGPEVQPTGPAENIPSPPPNTASMPPIVVEEDAGWSQWGQKVWDPWEGNIELGMNGTDGNTETFNIRVGMTGKHKTETLVQTLQFTTIQKSANGQTTANTALLDGRLDWPMPNSRLNYFIHGLAEYDQFKAFDVRLSGDTGFGYEFIQNDATTLIGRSGLAFSHEIGGPDTTVHPELLFGGEYKHKFNPTHSISAKFDFYPDVTEFSDFRMNSQLSWEIALKQAWGLSLKLSVIDRYDSTPQGAKPNDVDYSTLLLWTF